MRALWFVTCRAFTAWGVPGRWTAAIEAAIRDKAADVNVGLSAPITSRKNPAGSEVPPEFCPQCFLNWRHVRGAHFVLGYLRLAPRWHGSIGGGAVHFNE